MYEFTPEEIAEIREIRKEISEMRRKTDSGTNLDNAFRKVEDSLVDLLNKHFGGCFEEDE